MVTASAVSKQMPTRCSVSVPFICGVNKRFLLVFFFFPECPKPLSGKIILSCLAAGIRGAGHISNFSG